MQIRPEPLVCARCDARTLRRHCEKMNCRWAVCLQCDSVTGVISVWKLIGFVDGQTGEPVSTTKSFLRFDKNWFGGKHEAA